MSPRIQPIDRDGVGAWIPGLRPVRSQYQTAPESLSFLTLVSTIDQDREGKSSMIQARTDIENPQVSNGANDWAGC